LSVDALISLVGLLLQQRRHYVGREILRLADTSVLLILRLRRRNGARASCTEDKLIVLGEGQADASGRTIICSVAASSGLGAHHIAVHVALRFDVSFTLAAEHLL